MKKALCLIFVPAGDDRRRDGCSATRPAPRSVPGQYIVVFARLRGRRARAWPTGWRQPTGGRRASSIEHALKGFAAELPEQAVEALRRNPNVAYVEPDSVVWAVSRPSRLPHGGWIGLTSATCLLTTHTPTTRPAPASRPTLSTPAFATLTATSVVEPASATTPSAATAATRDGHGTHVAGTVGGATYGVAKGVTLKAVRVLDCNGSGSTSGVIAGIDWVTANHVGRPAVANMSLGGRSSSTLDAAVREFDRRWRELRRGGRQRQQLRRRPECLQLLALPVTEAMTIGATDSTDKKASWSNYGSCVDWFAPGVSITSDWYTGDTATNTISGTSMATPHTAGVAALYLEAYPSASPATVRNALYDLTTKGVVTCPTLPTTICCTAWLTRPRR